MKRENAPKIIKDLDACYILGRLLGYPRCCTDYFVASMGKKGHGVHWNGFIPCLKHSKLNEEEISTILGRSPCSEPYWLHERTTVKRIISESRTEYLKGLSRSEQLEVLNLKVDDLLLRDLRMLIRNCGLNKPGLYKLKKKQLVDYVKRNQPLSPK